MKKLRVLSLLLVLVLLVSAFAACGKEDEPEPTDAPTPPPEETQDPTTFADILNAEYSLKEPVVSAITALPELDGYAIMYYDEDYGFYHYYYCNEYYAVFQKVNDDDPENIVTTYKVFSFPANKVVATFADNNGANYTFLDFDKIYFEDYNVYSPSISVMKEIVELDEYDYPTGKTTYVHTVYDLTGKVLVSKPANNYYYYGSADFERPELIEDLVVFENDLYTYDEKTGALNKKGTIPANLDTEILWNGIEKTKNYIYYDPDPSNLIVYNYDLEPVASWVAPANCQFTTMEVLNSEDVLIQYQKELKPDAAEYDFYSIDYFGNMRKFDLVTEIFSVKDKTSKVIDFDYQLYDCLSYRESDEDNMYASTFENVVTVYSIVDKKLSNSYADIDFFMFSNDGVLGDSLKLVENQIALPEVVANGTFAVQTLAGYAIVDLDGEVIAQVTSADFDVIGSYIVTDYAIYDLNFKLVYDFSENNAERIETIGNTIFVKQYVSATNQDDYSILSFANGKKTEVAKYSTQDTNAPLSHYIYVGDDIYCIQTYNENAAEYEYKFYNSEEKLLATTNFYLYVSNGMLTGTNNEGVVVYYSITK